MIRTNVVGFLSLLPSSFFTIYNRKQILSATRLISPPFVKRIERNQLTAFFLALPNKLHITFSHFIIPLAPAYSHNQVTPKTYHSRPHKPQTSHRPFDSLRRSDPVAIAITVLVAIATLLLLHQSLLRHVRKVGGQRSRVEVLQELVVAVRFG